MSVVSLGTNLDKVLDLVSKKFSHMFWSSQEVESLGLRGEWLAVAGAVANVQFPVDLPGAQKVWGGIFAIATSVSGLPRSVGSTTQAALATLFDSVHRLCLVTLASADALLRKHVKTPLLPDLRLKMMQALGFLLAGVDEGEYALTDARTRSRRGVEDDPPDWAGDHFADENPPAQYRGFLHGQTKPCFLFQQRNWANNPFNANSLVAVGGMGTWEVSGSEFNLAQISKEESALSPIQSSDFLAGYASFFSSGRSSSEGCEDLLGTAGARKKDWEMPGSAKLKPFGHEKWVEEELPKLTSKIQQGGPERVYEQSKFLKFAHSLLFADGGAGLVPEGVGTAGQPPVAPVSGPSRSAPAAADDPPRPPGVAGSGPPSWTARIKDLDKVSERVIDQCRANKENFLADAKNFLQLLVV